MIVHTHLMKTKPRFYELDKLLLSPSRLMHLHFEEAFAKEKYPCNILAVFLEKILVVLLSEALLLKS